MSVKHEMTIHHRINVWRIADKCPVCGSARGYSPANPGGIECYCSNDNCGYSAFFSNGFIHNYGARNDVARFEILDSNNNVKDGWYYHPKKWEKQAMCIHVKKLKLKKERIERNKDKIYANLLDEVHCRGRDHTIKIKKCYRCSFCEEHGFENNSIEFSKCNYPLK